MLSEYAPGQEIRGTFDIEHPHQKFFDPATQEIVDEAVSDVPDFILINGRLQESETVRKDAVLSLNLRRGNPFPGETPLVWQINGEKGAIRILSPTSALITIGTPNDPQVFEVLDYATGNVDKVEWEFEDWQLELPHPARNIGAIYEEYAAAKESGATPRYATFDQALKRHQQLDEPISKWSA